jgi:hypothetical protein
MPALPDAPPPLQRLGPRSIDNQIRRHLPIQGDHRVPIGARDKFAVCLVEPVGDSATIVLPQHVVGRVAVEVAGFLEPRTGEEAHSCY